MGTKLWSRQCSEVRISQKCSECGQLYPPCLSVFNISVKPLKLSSLDETQLNPINSFLRLTFSKPDSFFFELEHMENRGPVKSL